MYMYMYVHICTCTYNASNTCTCTSKLLQSDFTNLHLSQCCSCIRLEYY